jgi:hypothetical protein
VNVPTKTGNAKRLKDAWQTLQLSLSTPWGRPLAHEVDPRHLLSLPRVFKDELRQAIAHPDQVPCGELSSHVQYDDGSPEKFLRRLWRNLYGGEPVPGHGQG